MPGNLTETDWWRAAVSLLQYAGSGKLAVLLRSLIEVSDLVSQLASRFTYRGMYEILNYDSTLEILDAKGKRAKLSRREVIRFLQDNVVAIHDHAWGNGDLFVDYQCRPGVPVDFYEDGSKHNVLISLRETKNRGDELDLRIERGIKNGLLHTPWWLETEVDHPMKHLKLSIVFPRDRHCKKATVTRRSTGWTVTLGEEHFKFLQDGRQQLIWETKHPKLHDLYTIKWIW